MVGSMVTTITIALVESWQYTLGYLPLVPIAAALGTIKLRRAHESSKIEHSSFEEAGKVHFLSFSLDKFHWFPRNHDEIQKLYGE